MPTFRASPAARSAAAVNLVNLREGMTNQQIVNSPLTLEQAELLVSDAPGLKYRAVGVRKVLEVLSSPGGQEPERAQELLDAAGHALFDVILPCEPHSTLLARFINCAWRYERTAWHARAVTTYRVRLQQAHEDPLAHAA